MRERKKWSSILAAHAAAREKRRKIFPWGKILELRDVILKEHSEEDLMKTLVHIKEHCFAPKALSELYTLLDLLDSGSLSSTHQYLAYYLNSVCRILKVNTPYHKYKDEERIRKKEKRRFEEERKREEKARIKARPPKIDYEEEIKKIQEKYQLKIQNWCKGDKTCFKRVKMEEFNEIIDLYLARIREPHKPIDEDGGRPPYVVWSLKELRREFIYIPRLPSENVDDYDSFLGGFYKQYSSGESLDYRKIAGEILEKHQLITEGYEIIVGWGK